VPPTNYEERNASVEQGNAVQIQYKKIEDLVLCCHLKLPVRMIGFLSDRHNALSSTCLITVWILEQWIAYQEHQPRHLPEYCARQRLVRIPRVSRLT